MKDENGLVKFLGSFAAFSWFWHRSNQPSQRGVHGLRSRKDFRKIGVDKNEELLTINASSESVWPCL